jgi:hypothetical protein
MLEQLQNGNMKQTNGNSALSPTAASVKMGGADNPAYGGFPQSDDPSVLEQGGEQKIDEPAQTMIAARLNGVWERNKRHRESNGIDAKLTDCLLMFSDEYDSVSKAKLQQEGEPDLFFPLARHKAFTATAWLAEFFTDGPKVFQIHSSPRPELDAEVVDAAANEAMSDIVGEVGADGEMPPPEMVEEYAAQKRPLVEDRIKSEAERRANAMWRTLKDDMVQGGWSLAMHDLICETCVYGTAAFRSPVVRVEKKRRWDRKDKKLVKEDRVTRSFEAVSPFDLFPSPGMTDTQHGDMIVRVRYRPNELALYRGQPCWVDAAIEQALSLYGENGVRLEASSDTIRRNLTGQLSDGLEDGLIEGFEFWGHVNGASLRQIGIEKDANGGKIADTTYDFYQVNAIVIGTNVVYCRVMDECESRPIDAVRFHDIPGAFFGIGPLHLLAAIQRICNSAGRDAVVNMASAAAPQTAVDLSVVRDMDLRLRRWKVWRMESNPQNPNAKGVSFFSPDFIAQSLTNVFDFFMRLGDEVTGIPAFANGTDAATGASRTATGLNLLLGTANRGVKHVAGNFDDVALKAIRRLWEWHMDYNPDESIKGDVEIEVLGLKNFSSKNQQATERLNLIARISQDERMKEMQGPMELAKLLHEIEAGFDLPENCLAPAIEDLKERLEQQRQEQEAAQLQQQMMAQQQVALEAQGEGEAAEEEEQNPGGLTPTGRPDYPARPTPSNNNVE